MNYWLLKSEPTTYSISDLEQDQTTIWDGVRNYQARNLLRSMQIGDQAFFYHSNCKPPGIVGLATVVATDIIDPTQFEPDSPYYDPKATPDQPRWYTVTVEFVKQFPQMISLETLKQHFSDQELWVVRRGNRLSVIPVDHPIAERILALATEVASSIHQE